MAENKLNVTWHGHSCFTLANSRYTLVLDPYKPDMIGYPPLKIKAHAMLASHQHEDHNYKPSVDFQPISDTVLQQIPCEKNWPVKTDPNLFYYKSVQTKHDPNGGSQRGDNIVHVVHSAGLTVAHLGDLGHILSDDQAACLQRQPVDLLLIPVGGHFTIDAEQAVQTVQQIRPRLVAPMHYKHLYGSLPISTVDAFLEMIKSSYPVRQLPDSTLQLTGDDENLCCLFQFR